MQIFFTTWQEHWLVNNLAQLPTKSKFQFPSTILLQNHPLFFCTLHLKPTNLEVTYLIQVTKSLYKFGDQRTFCAVQEISLRVFN